MQEFIEIPATLQSLNQRKPLFGVGINDADYMVFPRASGKQVMCPYYRAWHNMIKRCYSVKSQEKSPTYIECSVTKEWLIFSNFRAWMEKQDCKGKELDKDILSAGNKVYGPDACIFVSATINCLLSDAAGIRGEYPKGVGIRRDTGRYRAYCNVKGRSETLGCLDTVEEAEYTYLTFKSDLIKKTAYESEAASNPNLQAALLRHSNIFYAKAEEINLQKNLAVL